jgi:hypothetical protein
MGQFLELFESRGVLRTHVVRASASRVGVLQCLEHRFRQRNRITAMAGLADKIPFGFRFNVAPEAVSTKPIDDFSKAALVDRCAFFGCVELEEFPVVGDFVETLRLLNHNLCRHELNDGARRVHAAVRRPGYFQGGREVSRKIPNKETAYRFQKTDTAEGLVGHRDRRGARSTRNRSQRQSGAHQRVSSLIHIGEHPKIGGDPKLLHRLHQTSSPSASRQRGTHFRCPPQLFDAAVIQSISNLDAIHGMIERC